MQGEEKEQRYKAFLTKFWACNQRDGFTRYVNLSR